MVKKFILHLVEDTRSFTHEVNCANKFQAVGICGNIYPNARIVEVQEIS